MAKTEEIRDGLFSISWTVPNFSSTTPASQVVVDNLQKILLKSCNLTCKLENNCVILEMKTADPPDLLKRVVIMASYCGLKVKMTLSESTWKASWNWTPLAQCGFCGFYGQRVDAVSFDIFLDFKSDCVVSVKKHVLNNLVKLWENKTLSDVTFNCGQEVIKAHTSILSSGSPVLAAMFQNDFKENLERVVLIKDIEAKVFENLLHYIYVGECELLKSGEGNGVADLLLVAADKYDVESLRKECELHLLQTLTLENVTKYLVFAHLHNSPELNETALNFIAKNAKAVCSREDWLQMMETYPKLCFQSVKLIVGC